VQCSLELALALPQRPEQYARTLREGLELTGRMRILVEALRELADSEASAVERVAPVPLQLDDVLRDTVAELLPVAESLNVQLQLVNPAPLPLRADRGGLARLMFRFLESALSLALPGSDLRIETSADAGHACLAVSWKDGAPPEHSPFSRPELGLLIAEAGLEQAGAECIHSQSDNRQTWTARLPLAAAMSQAVVSGFGDVK
jgi:hypothetical protein